jgi:hypothetical protein
MSSYARPERTEIRTSPDAIPSHAREGSTKRLAERLGVCRMTVERYARQRAATSAGLASPAGRTSGSARRAPRTRPGYDLTVAVSPSHAAAILAVEEAGATDNDLHGLVAEAIADT